MLPLRESNRFRGFPFELHRFRRRGLEVNRHFVAVLIAALVDDFLHFRGGGFRKRERPDRHVIALCPHGDLSVIRVHYEAFKLIKSGLLWLWLHRSDDDGGRSISDDDRHGRRTLRRSRRRKNARRCKHQRQSQPGNLSDSLHSTSSVAIRSDFKNRTSCGVMASRGPGFLSFSSRKDSLST